MCAGPSARGRPASESGTLCHRDGAPRTARPPPEGVHVAYPLSSAAGAKVAITLSVIGAVVGEFVGSDKGLGYVILSSTSYWKTELAFSAMILLSLMAIVLFAAVSLIERLACPWLAPDEEA